MFCPACGSRLERDDRFCTRCGRPADPPSLDERPIPVEAPSRPIEIEVTVPRDTVVDLLRGGPPRETVVDVTLPSNARNFRPTGVGMGNPRIITDADRHADPGSGRRGFLKAVVVVAIGVGLTIWAGNLSAARLRGDLRPMPTPAPRESPTPVPEQARQEAVALLGSATYRVEEGKLGEAIELARQAQARWPGYPEAREFLDDVVPKATTTAAVARAQATAAAVASDGMVLSERDAVARVLPSIVHVATSTGVGTGFVVRDDLVATNAHVVRTAPTVQVRAQDGRTFEGRVVARDPRQDIALVRTTGSRLPVAKVGNSKGLRPGDALIAIGYALDLRGGPSVTRGVYSAHRSIQGGTYVQTDAPLNPGNSGGPLISLRGEVVGMNTMATVSANGADVRGLYFAVAIESVTAAANAAPR